jgi:hypothetical protein
MEGLRGDALMVTQKWGARQFAVAEENSEKI